MGAISCKEEAEAKNVWGDIQDTPLLILVCFSAGSAYVQLM